MLSSQTTTNERKELPRRLKLSQIHLPGGGCPSPPGSTQLQKLKESDHGYRVRNQQSCQQACLLKGLHSRQCTGSPCFKWGSSAQTLLLITKPCGAPVPHVRCTVPCALSVEGLGESWARGTFVTNQLPDLHGLGNLSFCFSVVINLPYILLQIIV